MSAEDVILAVEMVSRPNDPNKLCYRLVSSASFIATPGIARASGLVVWKQNKKTS